MDRRKFLASAATISAAGFLNAQVKTEGGAPPSMAAHSSALQFGVATYSLRKFPRDKAIAMIKELGITNVNIKDVHLSMKDSPEQIKANIKEFTDAGLK